MITLALLLVVALLATVTLGDMVGRGGGEIFTYRVRSGSASVESTRQRDDAEALAAWADSSLARLAEHYGATKPEVVIRLLDNETRYAAFGRQNLPGFSGAMRFCYARSDAAVYGWWCPRERLQERLQHEFIHRIAHTCMPGLPLWLEEGSAVLAETLSEKDGRLVQARTLTPRLDQAVRLIDDHGPANVPALLASPKAEFVGPRGFDLYSLSYATVASLDAQGQLVTALRTSAPAVDGVAVRAFASARK